MPFIDVKLSEKISDEKKEELKSRLGEGIGILHKPESYLMVGIADGYDLYFAGKKLACGAFVSVSVFGKVNPTDAEKMTRRVCDDLEAVIGVKGENVYVTYSGVADWGWNGGNF